MGHTAKDCPKSQKRQGRNPSKFVETSAKNSLTKPAQSGSKKSGSSSPHLSDLCEKLQNLKKTFVPPVASGKDSVLPKKSQPTSPPVVVVEAVPVATSSSPGAQQSEVGLGLQKDSFEFSLAAPQVDHPWACASLLPDPLGVRERSLWRLSSPLLSLIRALPISTGPTINTCWSSSRLMIVLVVVLECGSSILPSWTMIIIAPSSLPFGPSGRLNIHLKLPLPP